MKKYNIELNYSRVKEIRIERKMTQKQMAEKLNISKPTYTQFELGTRSIFPITKFNQVSNIFEVSLNYLVNLTNNPSINMIRTELNSELIGKRLKEIRIENRLYQNTLAKELGCATALICEYENGKRLLSFSNAYAICVKFNISMDWLLGKIDDQKYL